MLTSSSVSLQGHNREGGLRCQWIATGFGNVSNDEDDVGHLINIDKLYPRLVVFVILPDEPGLLE